MKNQFKLALLSAIALVGTAGFTACSSSDDATATAADNPNYNPATNEVNAQFVLNVSSAEQATTKQSAAMVQKNSNFRGIQDARLIGLSTGRPTYLAPYNGEATGSFEVNKAFDLGTIYGSSAISAENNEASSSRRVLQLAMPLNTDAMLVYARAIPSGTDEENGKVKINLTEKPEEITINLVSRLADRGARYEQACDLGATILNRILDANVSDASAGDFSHNGYTLGGDVAAISWKELGTKYTNNISLSPLEEILGKAYATITTINDGELRAGSGLALLSYAQSLYSSATGVYNAKATDDNEANAQRLAIEIRGRIEHYFNTDNGNVTEWRSIGKDGETGSIINNLIGDGIVTTANWSTRFGLIQSGDLRNLPTSFGLPFGAAILYKKDNGEFSYRNPSPSLLEKDQTTEVANYMYPAELLYFDNSGLRVCDEEKKVEDYPDGVTPWDTGSWTGWNNGAVTSTTRSVAVKNSINYGVAMLQTKVALDGTSFLDNRNAIVSSETNQVLSAEDVKKFKLTGILIGGQNHQLGWNYLAKSSDASDWDYVIFDNQIAGTGAIPTPTGEENYTLVFDNYINGAQNDQTDVLVALEFENQSKDFYGKGNMVRYGGKFYLIGKLELGDKRIADANWHTYYAVPPYTAAGATNKISRVFIQDFMTTATFKIGNTSLQNALVTIPDLRSSQTSLGLSVDLQWQPGLTFDPVLGGLSE